MHCVLQLVSGPWKKVSSLNWKRWWRDGQDFNAVALDTPLWSRYSGAVTACITDTQLALAVSYFLFTEPKLSYFPVPQEGIRCSFPHTAFLQRKNINSWANLHSHSCKAKRVKVFVCPFLLTKGSAQEVLLKEVSKMQDFLRPWTGFCCFYSRELGMWLHSRRQSWKRRRHQN